MDGARGGAVCPDQGQSYGKNRGAVRDRLAIRGVLVWVVPGEGEHADISIGHAEAARGQVGETDLGHIDEGGICRVPVKRELEGVYVGKTNNFDWDEDFSTIQAVGTADRKRGSKGGLGSPWKKSEEKAEAIEKTHAPMFHRIS